MKIFEIVKRSREEGLQAGREEGLMSVRQSIEAIVQKRFPKLLPLAEKQASQLCEHAHLQELLLKACTARTARELRAYLSSLSPE